MERSVPGAAGPIGPAPLRQACSLTDPDGVKVFVDGVFWNGDPLPFGTHVVSFQDTWLMGHPDPVTVTTSPYQAVRVRAKY
jgi:hypothetical protein